ncbi:hypothetical protein Trydic_g2001 [Trypoxylus dichotomus]
MRGACGHDRCGVASAGVATVAAGPHHRVFNSHWDNRYLTSTLRHAAPCHTTGICATSVSNHRKEFRRMIDRRDSFSDASLITWVIGDETAPVVFLVNTASVNERADIINIHVRPTIGEITVHINDFFIHKNDE